MNKLEKLQLSKVLTLDEYSKLKKWSGPSLVSEDGNKSVIKNLTTKLVTTHYVIGLEDSNQDRNSLSSGIPDPKWDKHVELLEPKIIKIDGNNVKINLLPVVNESDITAEITDPSELSIEGSISDSVLEFTSNLSGVHKILLTDSYGTSITEVQLEVERAEPEEIEDVDEELNPEAEDY